MCRMGSTLFTIDTRAVQTVAVAIRTAAAGLTLPPEPRSATDRFLATAAAVGGIARARTQIGDFGTTLSALSEQIGAATAQFEATEQVNTARLGAL